MKHEFSSHNRASAAFVGLGSNAQETCGERLDAGLAADQAWRGEREEKLRRKLELLHRLHAGARRGCVIAGMLEVFWVALLMAATAGASESAGVAAVCLGAAIVVLLGACGVAVPVIAWNRRRLLKSAERNAISLGAAPSQEAFSQSEDGGEHAPDGRVAQLEREASQVYSDERSLVDICMFGAHVITAICVLLGGVCLMNSFDLASVHLGLLGIILAGVALIVFYVMAIVAAVALVFMLFAAPGSVVCAYRRKRLLREAARLGYALRDPARFPGDR